MPENVDGFRVLSVINWRLLGDALVWLFKQEWSRADYIVHVDAMFTLVVCNFTVDFMFN